MLVAVSKSGKIDLQNRPVPQLTDFIALKKFKKGESVHIARALMTLVRVEAASVCGTDLHILKGMHDSTEGVILGHEYVGEIIMVGSAVEKVKVGDRVAIDPNVKCYYQCAPCLSGRTNMCENMTTLGIFADGGFSEFNLVPERALHLLPNDLPVERAVLFEPLTTVVHGMKQLGRAHPPERVLIYGAGPIGALFTALSVRSGASEVVVVEPAEVRRDFVQDLGAQVLTPNEKLEPDSFDVVIDAAGISGILASAIESAKPGGRILIFGQQNINARDEINPTRANQKELRIIGSYAASYSFDETIKLLSDKRIPFERFVTQKMGLSEIGSAFEHMKEGDAVKILIQP